MLTIKSINNITFTIDITDCITILDIKHKINQYNINDMRLIFNGCILEDQKNIKYYGIDNNSFIILYIITKQNDDKKNDDKKNDDNNDNKNLINSINSSLQSVGYSTVDIKNSMNNTNNDLLLTLSDLDKNDNKNINALVALGFSKNIAKQAYYACERNLNNAANFLFNSM